MSDLRMSQIRTKDFEEILILISSPLLVKNNNQFFPVPPISIRQEIESIEESFRRFTDRKFQINFEIATIQNIRQLFSRSVRPSIIHFIGHGIQDDEETALIVEDNCGLAYSLDENTLGSLLKPLLTQRKPPCQIAILNACYSEGLSDVLLDAGVPHVISIKFGYSILDRAALLFSENFYPLLLEGGSIQSCFESARDAIIHELGLLNNVATRDKEIGFNEALKYRLLPDNSMEHQQSLILPKEAGELLVLDFGMTNISLEKNPFLGRQEHIHAIVSHFEEQLEISCLGVHGIGRIGKTALVQAVATWYLQRNRWPEGVWIIHLRNNTNPEYIVNFLNNIFGYKNHSLDQLLKMIEHRKMLLILDDIDDLLQTDPSSTLHILDRLSALGHIRIIVTSRRLLPGTFHYKPIHLSEIGRLESKALFTAISFIEKDEIDTNGDDFEKLLDFLDGYPFAIRLAATYLRQTQCCISDMLIRLHTKTDESLSFPNLPKDRDTSLFKTLEISYNALPAGAKFVFPLVSIFPGGVSEDFATYVFDRDSIYSLESLYQFSMIEIEKIGNHRRFFLPEPARAYGENRLRFGNFGDIDNYRTRALAFYFDFSKKVTVLDDKTSSLEDKISSLLEEESTLNYILSWGYENEEVVSGVSQASRITLMIEKFKFEVDWKSEKTESNLINSLRAAERCEDIESILDIKLFIGDFYFKNKKFDLAMNSYAEVEILSAENGFTLTYAMCKERQGLTCCELHNNDDAIKHYLEAFRTYDDLRNSDIYREGNLSQNHSRTSYHLAIVYLKTGLNSKAKFYFGKTITISRSSIDNFYVFEANKYLAEIYLKIYDEKRSSKEFIKAFDFYDYADSSAMVTGGAPRQAPMSLSNKLLC